MNDKICLLVAYDIRANKTRTKFSDALIEIGMERVNKSVFEGYVSENRFSKILKEHTLSIKGEDTVLVYRINQEISLTKKVYQKRKSKKGSAEPRIF